MERSIDTSWNHRFPIFKIVSVKDLLIPHWHCCCFFPACWSHHMVLIWRTKVYQILICSEAVLLYVFFLRYDTSTVVSPWNFWLYAPTPNILKGIVIQENAYHMVYMKFQYIFNIFWEKKKFKTSKPARKHTDKHTHSLFQMSIQSLFSLNVFWTLCLLMRQLGWWCESRPLCYCRTVHARQKPSLFCLSKVSQCVSYHKNNQKRN